MKHQYLKTLGCMGDDGEVPTKEEVRLFNALKAEQEAVIRLRIALEAADKLASAVNLREHGMKISLKSCVCDYDVARADVDKEEI